MLRQLRENEKGVVFITVLVIILVMMTLTVSIISMNVTQTVSTEAEIRRIQAEVLALGALPYTFSNQLAGSASDFITYTETLGNTIFTITANVSGPGLPNYVTNGLDISVTY